MVTENMDTFFSRLNMERKVCLQDIGKMKTSENRSDHGCVQQLVFVEKQPHQSYACS